MTEPYLFKEVRHLALSFDPRCQIEVGEDPAWGMICFAFDEHVEAQLSCRENNVAAYLWGKGTDGLDPKGFMFIGFFTDFFLLTAALHHRAARYHPTIEGNHHDRPTDSPQLA